MHKPTNHSDLTAIEKEFQASWIRMERFFAQYIIIHGRTDLEPIYRFIFFANMAFTENYTTKLRAGQSMDMLILSRSREHGLQEGQPWLRIFLHQDSNFCLIYKDNTSRLEVAVETLFDNQVIIVDELKAMLDNLVEQPIT